MTDSSATKDWVKARLQIKVIALMSRDLEGWKPGSTLDITKNEEMSKSLPFLFSLS